MDTRSTNAEAQQSLYGGVDVDVVSVDDGIIWEDAKKERFHSESSLTNSYVRFGRKENSS